MDVLGLVKLGILLALFAGVAYAIHSHDERVRLRERQAIEAAAAKAQLQQQEAWTRRAQENEEKAKIDDAKIIQTFSPLKRRADALSSVPHPVPSAGVREFERLFNDAYSAAEATRAPALAPEAAPAPSASTEQLVVELYGWAAGAIVRDQQWRAFYESLRREQK